MAADKCEAESKTTSREFRGFCHRSSAILSPSICHAHLGGNDRVPRPPLRCLRASFDDVAPRMHGQMDVDEPVMQGHSPAVEYRPPTLCHPATQQRTPVSQLEMLLQIEDAKAHTTAHRQRTCFLMRFNFGCSVTINTKQWYGFDVGSARSLTGALNRG